MLRPVPCSAFSEPSYLLDDEVHQPVMKLS